MPINSNLLKGFTIYNPALPATEPNGEVFLDYQNPFHNFMYNRPTYKRYWGGGV